MSAYDKMWPQKESPKTEITITIITDHEDLISLSHEIKDLLLRGMERIANGKLPLSREKYLILGNGTVVLETDSFRNQSGKSPSLALTVKAEFSPVEIPRANPNNPSDRGSEPSSETHPL